MKLLDILAEFDPVQLSSGQIKCRCPFTHLHSSDSQRRKQMFLTPDKNLYHCFSCGSANTLTSLLTTKFGVSLYEAIDLVNFEVVTTVVKLTDYDQPDIFTHKLPEFQANHLLSYATPPEEFLDRGFTLPLLQRFGVGLNKVVHEKLGEIEVITIPLIQDDKLVGVKYRGIGEHNRVFWYSKGFQKEHFLYNFDRVKKLGRIGIVVEGESDLYQCIRNGEERVFASLGGELSESHISMIQDSLDTLYIAYDNDSAGFLFKEKAYQKLKHSVKLLFVPYNADDPGSCSKANWNLGMMAADDYAVYSMEMMRLLEDEYIEIQNTAISQLKKSGWL